MRKASSLIELIVAIMVMGLVAVTIPSLIGQSTSNNAFSLAQEAITEAKTQVIKVMSYDWDNNSYSTDDQKLYIVNTNSADANLNARNGITTSAGRRRLNPAGETASNINATGITNIANAIAIEDFNSHGSVIKNSGKIDAGLIDADKLDVIYRNSSLTTAISYGSDATIAGQGYGQQTVGFVFNPTPIAAAGGSRNIKIISVTASLDFDADETNEDITLRAFSSNIGESTPLPPRDFL